MPTVQNTREVKIEDLTFGEQCALTALEILIQVLEGRRNKAEVERVINDLMVNLPWNVTVKDVQRVADVVAVYGIQELPGYVEPVDAVGN